MLILFSFYSSGCSVFGVGTAEGIFFEIDVDLVSFEEIYLLCEIYL